MATAGKTIDRLFNEERPNQNRMATPTQTARLIVARICKTRQLPVRGFKSCCPIKIWKTWEKGLLKNTGESYEDIRSLRSSEIWLIGLATKELWVARSIATNVGFARG